MLPVLASAVDFYSVPCAIISQIVGAVDTIGPVFVLIMLTYGAIKYVQSVDNPGGRKQGKDIFIQAIIGGLLYMLWGTVIKGLLTTSLGWLKWDASNSCLPP
jgi:hypothetical protein